MSQKKFIPEEHKKTRSVFRLLGPIILIIGFACMLVAAIDFFTLEGFEEPQYFWLFFLAMPTIFVGFILTALGYGGSVAKYQSREYAPVAKDTFNYLAKETTSGVKDIANALQQGSEPSLSLNCNQCHHTNPIDAKFCNGCGEKLVLVCHSCKHINTSDAHFCNQCGISLE